MSYQGSLARVAAKNTSGASIPTAATTVPQNWTTLTDTGSNFNATTGTFTAPRTGKYLVSASMVYQSAAWTAGNELHCGILQNGVEVAANYTFAAGSLSTQMGAGSITFLVSAVAGDTIQPQVYQNSGGARLLATAAQNNTFLVVEL